VVRINYFLIPYFLFHISYSPPLAQFKSIHYIKELKRLS